MDARHQRQGHDARENCSECVAKRSARIGKEQVDRLVLYHFQKGLRPRLSGQIGTDDLYIHAEPAKRLGGFFDFLLVGTDRQIVTVLTANRARSSPRRDDAPATLA